jgi:hypothetical protein
MAPWQNHNIKRPAAAAGAAAAARALVTGPTCNYSLSLVEAAELFWPLVLCKVQGEVSVVQRTPTYVSQQQSC